MEGLSLIPLRNPELSERSLSEVWLEKRLAAYGSRPCAICEAVSLLSLLTSDALRLFSRVLLVLGAPQPRAS